MSKVKIEGHGTGTGTFTVTTPSSNTDRTITLPDATGTLLNSDGDGSSLTGISSVGGATGVDFNDSVKARFGTGNDLSIYHDQTNSQSLLLSPSLPIMIASTSTKFANGANDTLRMTIDGDGLKFNGDTAEANALYDYESGSWTPNLSVKPSGVALGTVTVADYTKIGDRVFISLQCLITSSSVPAPNNDMRLTGFPFTNANSGVNMPAVFNYNYKETPQLHMNGSGYLYFQDTTVGGNNQSPAGGGLDASTTLSLAIQYKTNS